MAAAQTLRESFEANILVIVLSSVPLTPASATTATTGAFDLLVAAAAAVATAHRLVAAVGIHLGCFAAADVADPGRFLRTVVDLCPRLWLAGRAVNVWLTAWPVCSLPALPLQPVERALAHVSRPGGLARPPVRDLVALLDVTGAVTDRIVGVALDVVLYVGLVELVQLVAVD